MPWTSRVQPSKTALLEVHSRKSRWRSCPRGSPVSTSSCLAAPCLAPQPFAHQPFEGLTMTLRRTAPQPSSASSANRVASVSLAAPLVLIYALPAEIWRRRPSRRRPEAPRAAWAPAAGRLRHPLAAERAAPRLPRAHLARSPPRTLKPCFSGRSGEWLGSLCPPLGLPTGRSRRADRWQTWQACLGRAWGAPSAPRVGVLALIFSVSIEHGMCVLCDCVP